MRRLIVNADDLGADEARNRGIFDAIEAGTVTSVSVLANGHALEDAKERWRRVGRTDVSLGIHINLSEGKPLTDNLHRLTGDDGFFRGKRAALDLLDGEKSHELQDDIEREISAQIGALRPFNTPITHLDGHQHVHVTANVLPIALAAASTNNICWIRIPDEPDPSIKSLITEVTGQDEIARFRRLGMAARSHVMFSPINSPDHFRGLYLKGRLDINLLSDLLRDLPMGLTELMVHPGRFAETGPENPFAAFSTQDREKELETLLNPVFPVLLEKYGIRLIPFPEGL